MKQEGNHLRHVLHANHSILKRINCLVKRKPNPHPRMGHGNSKTIMQLFQEISKGECLLINDPPKRILPVVQVIIRLGAHGIG